MKDWMRATITYVCIQVVRANPGRLSLLYSDSVALLWLGTMSKSEHVLRISIHRPHCLMCNITISAGILVCQYNKKDGQEQSDRLDFGQNHSWEGVVVTPPCKILSHRRTIQFSLLVYMVILANIPQVNDLHNNDPIPQKIRKLICDCKLYWS